MIIIGDVAGADDGGGPPVINPALPNDKEVALSSVTEDDRALEHVSKVLKGGDKQVILVTIRQNGHALEYAFKEMKGDTQVVLAAVRQSVCALEHASADMKGDKEQGLSFGSCDTKWQCVATCVLRDEG